MFMLELHQILGLLGRVTISIWLGFIDKKQKRQDRCCTNLAQCPLRISSGMKRFSAHLVHFLMLCSTRSPI